jgi:hypothetical protein
MNLSQWTGSCSARAAKPNQPVPRITCKTASAWPGTLAGRHTASINPVGPTTNVLRTIPCILRPYMIFSPKAPYAAATRLSGSVSSGNGSECLPRNFACALRLSPLTPSTGTFALSKAAWRSRKSHASVVQPGVLSRG